MDSYTKCKCYMPEYGTCSLPAHSGQRYIQCWCKESKPEEFCIWLSNFLKSKPKNLSAGASKELDKYMVYISLNRVSFADLLANLF